MEKQIKEVTKQEQVELFQWLFGENIEILEELDISLAPYYEDINVYYTKEIYQLFQTKAMKRTGKIMQLSANIFRKSNTYHTRLEHEKGAYRNAVQFLSVQYRNPEWRKYIENNHLKSYLVEKIKFMCVHDIGHSMFSHAIEKLIGDENCTHEDIGEKIVQEDKEVKEALGAIQAKEQESKLEGDGSLELFCEGNIDFDRMDFLLRDMLYTGDEYTKDLILKLHTMCQLKEVEGKYRYVYKAEALPYIEEFLSLRDKMYKKVYKSKQRIIDDDLASRFVEKIKKGEISNTSKMQEYLKAIVGKNRNEIDVESILETNDILLLNQLLHAKEDLRNNEVLACIMPDNHTLLQVAINLLDPKHTNYEDYNHEEKEFIKKLRNSITNGVENKPIEIEKVIPSVRLKEDKREEIEQKIKEILGNNKEVKGIYNHKTRFRKYKKEEPIYIETKQGEIVTLDKHPDLQMDLSDEYYYDSYVILPELKEQGIETEKIEPIRAMIEEYQKEEVKIKEDSIEANRMSLFRTQQGGIHYEEKLNQFFEEETR